MTHMCVIIGDCRSEKKTSDTGIIELEWTDMLNPVKSNQG